MSTMWAIALKDIKEAFRNKSTYFYVAVMLVISLPSYLGGLRGALGQAATQNANPETIRLARALLDSAAYTQPITLSMLFCTYLSAYALILEKAKRTMESLLATPASLRQVWFGKSLAVALPSIAVTLAVLIVSTIVFNFTALMPRTGVFILPDLRAVLTVLLIVPPVIFSIVALVSLLQLVMANPRFANLAFIVVFFGFYMLTVLKVSTSWDFSTIYLMFLGVMVLVNALMSRILTKERVVLSSKA